VAIRPKPGSLLALLTAFCASHVIAQPQPDTVAFAQHLAAYGIPGRPLTAPELTSIETEYLAWLHARVTAGRTIDQMNAELAAVGVLDTGNRRNSGAGFVTKILVVQSTPGPLVGPLPLKKSSRFFVWRPDTDVDRRLMMPIQADPRGVYVSASNRLYQAIMAGGQIVEGEGQFFHVQPNERL
jgi:hypothetical protein